MLVCTVPQDASGVQVQNRGNTAVFLGGPDVTVEDGFLLAPGVDVQLLANESNANDLYGVAEQTTTVVFIYAA